MKIEEDKKGIGLSVSEDIVFPYWMDICMKIGSKYNLHVGSIQYLYHYTSLEGFQSIIQNRDFWISNIRYMNDSHEFENEKVICKEVIVSKLGLYKEDEMNRFLYGLLNACYQNISQGFGQ